MCFLAIDLLLFAAFLDGSLDFVCLFENACEGKLVDDLCLVLLFDWLFMFGCLGGTSFRCEFLAGLESVRVISFGPRRNSFRFFMVFVFWN
jgi:hypothetical protein